MISSPGMINRGKCEKINTNENDMDLRTITCAVTVNGAPPILLAVYIFSPCVKFD